MLGSAQARFFLAHVVLLIWAGPAGAAPPNLVLLLADDLGWVDTSSPRISLGNGSRFHRTPNIDRLAEQGMSFTAAYAQPNCAPSRAALLTGQSTPRNGVYSQVSLNPKSSARIVPPENRLAIRPSAVTVSETLRAAGHRTAHLGKFQVYGVRSDPTRDHGVDVNLHVGKETPSAGGRRSGQYFAARGPDGRWAFGKPHYAPYAAPYTRRYVVNELLPFADGNDALSLVGTPKHLTDAIADAAIDFIRESAAAGQPFFLNVSFHAVHTAITPRPDLAARYAGIESPDPRHRNPRYAAFVAGLDQSVGRIVAALDDPDGDGDPADGIAADTLVVFTSDNGGASATSNAPLRGRKHEFTEGGIRVPLVARMPGVIEAGSASGEPVHLVDLHPTFAEWVGAALPDPAAHPLDGESLAGILRGDSSRLERDALFWHYPGYVGKLHGPHSLVAKPVGGKRYKLFYYYEDSRSELYELGSDPGESRNLLAGSPAAEPLRIASELRAELRAWLEEVGAELGTLRDSGEAVALPPAASVGPG